MPSLMNRVTSFGRTPKGQSHIRQAMSRLSGGGDTNTKQGRRSGTRRGAGARRGGGTRTRTRAARKR